MTQRPNKSPGKADELMRRVADDDFEAFERLHQRVAPLLMYMASRRRLDPETADDLIQKIFLSLWEQRRRFRGESSFHTYFFSVANHSLNKELQRFYTRTEKDVEDDSQAARDSYSDLSEPESETYLQELIGAVEAAKAKLTTGQRKVLETSLAEEVPSAKTLEELGCSLKAYKKRLQRTRKRLKELLAPFLEEERYT